MARFCVIQIVIIGSGGWWSLRGQDTVGIYFSAKGFTFDPYYRKAILTSDEEHLSGKALFLLLLADSLSKALAQRELVGINLHRYPQLVKYVEHPYQLPQGWKSLTYVQQLELQAIPYKMVVAKSNRLYPERLYELKVRVKGVRFAKEGEYPFQVQAVLPPQNWREALYEVLLREVL
ncbi:MAG: hypothetical protein RMK19_07785 [Bacteroidia bacterium]|nr:hypothetical protein [Bacteroidia bacterium]MDW8015895.1 hypothetical protein [Bacteroidia bacterium]